MYYKVFVIAKNKNKFKNFKEIALPQGLNLYYTKDLKIKIAKNVVLIGDAIQTMKNMQNPESQIMQDNFKLNIEKYIESWAGRWMLLYDNNIYTDACNLLSLYYDKNNGIVTNSLSVLHYELGYKLRDNYEKIDKTMTNRNFNIGPNTSLNNIQMLMPSQSLKFIETGLNISTRQFLRDMSMLNDEEKFSLLDEALHEFMLNVENKYDKVYIPLTGGLDSRTTFSIAKNANIKFTAFTIDKKDITVSDKNVPRKICSIYNNEYKYIYRTKKYSKKEKQKKEEIYDRHVFFQAVDRDREYYINSMYSELETNNCVLLGSGIWEFCRNFYKFSSYDEDILKEELSRGMTKYFCNDLNCYFEYLKQYPINSLNFAERFYIDGRVSSFVSSSDVGFDLYNLQRIQPINCKYILSLIVSINERFKNGYLIEKKLIEKNAPLIYNIPINKLYFKDYLIKLYKRITGIVKY